LSQLARSGLKESTSAASQFPGGAFLSQAVAAEMAFAPRPSASALLGDFFQCHNIAAQVIATKILVLTY
jgi:hypothetical protein